ncbi:hypothetical protein [Pseudofrankia sp. DC12]|uniref:hypothetical protein n=1 Tax=Pseudofrankia sp. DC12 TaxID=683315 RepID=UPI000A4622A9|nr:hypothetical protein [Pseudofrankia sp. DC12]
MSSGDVAIEKSHERVREEARNFFEGELAGHGLSLDAIEKQNLTQLQDSLSVLDAAISNPQQFGLFRLKSNSALVFASVESSFEVGVLPLLLERKQLVLSRIRLLGGSQKIESIRDLIGQIDDLAIRENLAREVEELEIQARDLGQQSEQVRRAQEAERARVDRELAMTKLEVMERRWVVLQQFLGRESIATVIGSFLLVALTIALVVAMFSKTAVPEIVSSSFLIILGYFFGQSVNRHAERNP